MAQSHGDHFQFTHNFAALLTLRIRQPHDILLVHRNLLVKGRFHYLQPLTQPQFLDLTGHYFDA